MKRVQILGLFIGALLLVGYEPAAEAMPASAPGIAAGFVELSDGLWLRDAPRRVASSLVGAQSSQGGDTMKRVQILGLFIGALLLVGYEPAAEAMPASAPGIAAGFVSHRMVLL